MKTHFNGWVQASLACTLALLLAACGGGDASDKSVKTRSLPSSQDQSQNEEATAPTPQLSAPSIPLPHPLSKGAAIPNAQLTALSQEQVRDLALQRMREFDLVTGRHFSWDWPDVGYADWVKYLSGQITPSEYQTRAAANPGSDYYPRDPYGFNRPMAAPPSSPDYASIVGMSNPPCYFSGGLYNTLSAFYYSYGNPIYRDAWLAITRDMMVNERKAILQFTPAQLKASAANDCMYPEEGGSNWSATLTVGQHIANELYALALIAKSLELPVVSTARNQWGALTKPNTVPLSAAQRTQIPADVLVDIANGVANNYAPTLLKYYGVGSKRNPNQWLAGFMGPALLTEFFPTLSAVTALRPQVDAAAIDHITSDVYADGGILEQSVNYTDGMARDYARLGNFTSRSWTSTYHDTLPANARAPMAVSRSWVRNYRDAYMLYNRQQAALSNPQGGYPQVGNGEWNSGKRAQGYSFSQTSMAFPYSGYYVQRSDWSTTTPYLFFFSRRAANGHTMAGSNSVQVAAYGRKLVMAGGRANYAGTHANYPNSVPYLSEASTWKTSTIVVDGRSQLRGSTAGLQLDSSGNPDRYRAARTPIQARWATTGSFDFLEGNHDGDYGYDPYTDTTAPPSGVTHQRMVVFVRDIKAWVIVDFMRPSNSDSHEYTQIWKLAPPVPQTQGSGTQTEGFHPNQVELPAGAAPYRTYTNDTTAGAVNLSIYQASPQNLSFTKHHGADPGSKYGFYSTTPLFAPDIHVKWSGAGQQAVITVLLPFTGSGADGVSSVNHASAGGVAGLDMVIGGKRLGVRASPALTALSAGGKSMASGHLLVVESDAGANPRTVAIGDAAQPSASTITHGSTVTPVTIPTGFRWTEDGAGTLTADYGL